MAANQDDQEYEIERFIRFSSSGKATTNQYGNPRLSCKKPPAKQCIGTGANRVAVVMLRIYDTITFSRVLKKGKWYYHCQWVGYSDTHQDTTLEPPKKVMRIAKDVLAEFEARQAAGN
ncbi:hypothetical protein LB506_011481 [Fusarium annulatum]|nr:hypothetical protein LB506_011481 [Fusarium annulatum]